MNTVVRLHIGLDPFTLKKAFTAEYAEKHREKSYA